MLALLQLLPFLASAQAFFILSQPVLQTTRLDPIVNPGSISGHVHSIAGGSNFDRQMSLDSALDSHCTTAPITADKSNYWIPQLYYYNYKTGGYRAIPVAFVNTYYLPRGGGGKNETINAFPDGLRMLQGDGSRKSYDPKDPDDMSISYVCLDYSGKHAGDPEWDQRNSFFNHNCPDGLRAQVNFPTCWDGKNTDSGDHRSHLAWPIGSDNNGGGPCPASHPVKIVQLFYEFVFQVQDFPFNPAPYPSWVWSNGDTTGYGLHADFINGWPKLQNGTNVLQRAINECNINNGVGGNLQDCPPFQGLINNQQAGGCRPENELVDEAVGLSAEIPKLPGNNPMWNGQGTNPADPYYQEPEPLYRDPQSKIPAGYENVGCIAEATSGRALSAYTFTSTNMSKALCVQACADRKLPLAGIEYGSECYCDMQMRNGASNTTLLDSNSRCNMRCSGKRYENCGGSSTLELYVNKDFFTGPVGLPDQWSLAGCYDGQATSGRALTDYYFADSKMTPQMCTQECAKRGFNYAGIEYGQECRCGAKLNAGSGPKPEADCSFQCPGDGVYKCGAGNRMNLYKGPGAAATTATSTTLTASGTANATTAVNTTTAATTAVTTTSTTAAATTTASGPDGLVPISQVAGWGQIAQNCWTEGPGGVRALQGFAAAGSTMSVTRCVNACADRGFKYAGVEYGRECYCGNELHPQSKSADAASCNMACVGNATETCGGSNRLNLYQKMATAPVSSSTTSSSTVAASSTTSSSSTTTAATTSSTTTAATTSSTTTAATTSSTTTAATTSTTTSSTSTTPSPAPTPNNDNINVAGWVSRGCWSEGTSNQRTLPKFSISSSKMTNELALQRCQAAGMRWCGTEYAAEAWGGDAPINGGKQMPIEQCSMPCKGDAMTLCGAASRLSMWEFIGNDTTAATTTATTTASTGTPAVQAKVVASSSSSSSSSSTVSSSTTVAAPSSTTVASTTTASTAASSPTPSSPLPSNWVHLGCMTDGANTGDKRAFMAYRSTNSTQTWMSCAKTCADKGYKYAGASYGAECFCDNVMDPATTARPAAECDKKCPGDDKVTCGGAWRLNVFMLNSTASASQQTQGNANTATVKPAKRHQRSRSHTAGLGDQVHF